MQLSKIVMSGTLRLLCTRSRWIGWGEWYRNDDLLGWKVQNGCGPLCDFLGGKQNQDVEFAAMVKDIKRAVLTKAARRAGLRMPAWAMEGVIG